MILNMLTRFTYLFQLIFAVYILLLYCFDHAHLLYTLYTNPLILSVKESSSSPSSVFLLLLFSFFYSLFLIINRRKKWKIIQQSIDNTTFVTICYNQKIAECCAILKEGKLSCKTSSSSGMTHAQIIAYTMLQVNRSMTLTLPLLPGDVHSFMHTYTHLCTPIHSTNRSLLTF